MAEQFVTRAAPAVPCRRIRARDPHGPVKIGYLSADIRNHPVMHLGAALFECHDRSRFDVTCFSTGPPDDSVYRQRVVASADQFVDLHDTTDRHASALLEAADLDLIVDLSGHTQHSRTALLAQRPAPSQLSYLGYPGTTGATFIDGFVGDAYVSPNQDHFTETLLHLPRYYQINDWATKLGATPSRAMLGLPPDAVVLCSFASAYKLEPTIVECWGRILRRVPDAVLWLLDPGPEPRQRLRVVLGRYASRDRVLFAPSLDHSNHLSRLGAADLCLDTYLVGGHTTTSDAVRAGLPVVTCPRSPMISRVSASLLNQIAMADLVARDLDHYEEMAASLATDGARRHKVRRRLRHNSMESVVFKPADATAALEDLIMDVLRKRETNVAA